MSFNLCILEILRCFRLRVNSVASGRIRVPERQVPPLLVGYGWPSLSGEAISLTMLELVCGAACAVPQNGPGAGGGFCTLGIGSGSGSGSLSTWV